jgi:NAD+-dependent protein deacetylase sirtuin 6
VLRADGLHRRSGLPAGQLAEVHGNAFIEICGNCKAEFDRDYDVGTVKGEYYFVGATDPLSESGISHLTGRRCDRCNAPNGLLRDSIIHFKESLPVDHLQRACDNADKSDMALCIGSSLHVRPTCDLPKLAKGPLIINNLQATGKDADALASGGVLVAAKCDVFFAELMKALAIDLPPTDTERKVMQVRRRAHTRAPPSLHHRVCGSR